MVGGAEGLQLWEVGWEKLAREFREDGGERLDPRRLPLWRSVGPH